MSIPADTGSSVRVWDLAGRSRSNCRDAPKSRCWPGGNQTPNDGPGELGAGRTNRRRPGLRLITGEL
jgi:hypothetical protein